jgi:hypothetical protein
MPFMPFVPEWQKEQCKLANCASFFRLILSIGSSLHPAELTRPPFFPDPRLGFRRMKSFSTNSFMACLPIAFALLLARGSAAAQEPTEPEPPGRSPRFSLGFVVSVDYCYRDLVKTSGTKTTDLIIDTRNDAETYLLGYSLGFAGFCHLSSRFSASLGVSYSKKGYVFDTQALTYPLVIDPRYNLPYSTATPGNYPGAVKITYAFHYLEFPVKAYYSPRTAKCRPVFSVGLSPGWLIRQTQTVRYDPAFPLGSSSSTDNAYPFEKFNASPSVGAGVLWNPYENISLAVMPEYRYGILKIIDAPISARLWSAGLIIQFVYAID